MENMLNEILVYLFEGFKENGGSGLFSISPITSKYKADPLEVGRYLVSEGFVKEKQFRPTDFLCNISNEGIRIIAPEFIHNNLNKLVSTLGINSGEWDSIMAVLDFEPKDFQIAHRLAHIFQDMGLIETQFRQDDVYVKLTFTGKMHYEQNKAMFGS